MLEKEFEYFKKHKEDLKKHYMGKFIVIVGHKVIGSYEDSGEALREASKRYKMGSFLIQKISEHDEDYVQRFHSRICI